VASVPALLARGKLALLPREIEGIQEIRRIFELSASGKDRL